ncbi:NUDIX domain-containing protein [archaeon]|nr:NUDIX domain-containing protein [archaeon]MBL7057484.1 NUDIX domain-containing protein [Candidatus Woesearchaeota archaeon]
MKQYNFQYCQKIIVLSKDKKEIFLCKRKGEADYDGVFSFIGGKMENSDKTIIEGLKREKDEEVGINFKIKIYPNFCLNLYFTKSDGNAMIMPHYLAIHKTGEIDLNEEYSEYKWVKIDKLNEFEPKIPTIPHALKEILRLKQIAEEKEFVLI